MIIAFSVAGIALVVSVVLFALSGSSLIAPALAILCTVPIVLFAAGVGVGIVLSRYRVSIAPAPEVSVSAVRRPRKPTPL